MRQLLESDGCDVNERDGKEGSTPLLLAPICRRLEIAEMLIINNADMSTKNFMGIDVVHVALTMNYDTFLLLLMDHGVSINYYLCLGVADQISTFRIKYINLSSLYAVTFGLCKNDDPILFQWSVGFCHV